MAKINEQNTVEHVREELDNYGGHLPVVIESHDGNLFNVEHVTTAQPRGEVVVMIAIGTKITEF